MSRNDIEAFQRFVKAKWRRFEAIAWKTDNEYTPEDIKGEAWLMAPKVAGKLGVALNFDDPVFQERLIAFLYSELVVYTETVVRYAVKLDRQIDGEDVGIDDHPVIRKLAVDDFGNPLQYLLAKEEARDRLLEHGPHESRAGAYIHLLRIFDNKMREVAEHLLISRSYCYFRYNEARTLVERQLSLPEAGLATESANVPRSWRAFRVFIAMHVARQGDQLELDLRCSGAGQS